MKNIIYKAIGLILVASCLFGVFCVGGNLSDALKCKSSWEKLDEESTENLEMLGDGIDQLSENTKAYVDGAALYEESLIKYEEGVKAIEEAKATFEAGQKSYKTGVGSYYSGKATYDANVKSVNEAKEAIVQGEATLAEKKDAYEQGLVTLAENKDAYEEGKAQIQKVEPIMNVLAPVNDVVSTVPIIGGIADVKIGGNSINGLVKTYEEGKAQIKQYEDGMAQVAEYEAGVKKIADSKATVAEYDKQLAEAADKLSAGAAKLADAKKQLADGEIQIKDGEAQLADAEIQLAEGKASLAQYEDGEAQLADGLNTAINERTFYNENGSAILPSIKSRLGNNFTFYDTDSAGNVTVINGVDFISIEKARTVLDTAWEFKSDLGNAVTKEITGRILSIILAAAACLLGIFAGVGTFTDNRVLTSIVAAAAAIASAAAFFCISTASADAYVFSRHVGSEGHGHLALSVGVIVLASLLTCAVGFLLASGKKAKVAAAE